jgi:hypothetical protein
MLGNMARVDRHFLADIHAHAREALLHFRPRKTEMSERNVNAGFRNLPNIDTWTIRAVDEPAHDSRLFVGQYLVALIPAKPFIRRLIITIHHT